VVLREAECVSEGNLTGTHSGGKVALVADFHKGLNVTSSALAYRVGGSTQTPFLSSCLATVLPFLAAQEKPCRYCGLVALKSRTPCKTRF
jgi:hypothetical protein